MRRTIAVFAVLAAVALASAPALAQITNVTAAWESGHLVFRDAATRGVVLELKDGTDGAGITTATITSAAISGGTINGVAIGGTTPAAGTFTTLVAGTSLTVGSSLLVLSSVEVSSGSASAVATVNGTDADDLVLATPNDAGGQAILSAVPGTNNVTVTMAGNVVTTTTIALQVWQD